MASMAPYLGAQAAQTNLIGQSVYDMFTGARSKESQMAGVQTAMASHASRPSLNRRQQKRRLNWVQVARGLKGIRNSSRFG
jgi:hypothetical protein